MIRQRLLRRSWALSLVCWLAWACSPPPEQTPTAGQDAGSQPPAVIDEEPAPPAPALGTGDHTPASVVLTPIATFDSGLRRPRDLAFNPASPDELWIVNDDDDSVVIVFNTTQDSRTTEKRIDAAASHFLDSPSSIAFGAQPTTIAQQGTFATCQESRNTYNNPNAKPNDFMGPALWSSDLTVFAKHNPYGLGSHLDMLHGSPNCMGIAHERDNVYWVFGGKAHTGTTQEALHAPVPAIVRYDFGHDHGIGEDDHSDGAIHQYVTEQVSRVPGVPSHLIFDPSDARLYIADTGNGRVAALDTKSGVQGARLQGQEPLVAYYRMENASLVDLVPAASGLLERPSGIELKDGLIYVSDNASGWISAFNKNGERVNYLDTGLPPGALAGMAFGVDGKLYVVDMVGDRVLRIDPK